MNAANILFPVTNLFRAPKDDPTSFTQENGGKTPAEGQFAAEGIDHTQDSLTQSLRSLSNFTGQSGMDTLKTGQGTVASGKGTFEGATHDLAQPMDMFRKLLGGDRSEIESALGPEKDAITGQFDKIREMFATTGARGGGRTSTLTQLPFQQTKMISDLISKARMGAASAEGNLALNKAQLGLGEAGVGLGEEGIGQNLLGLTNQNLLGRRGQNVQVNMANTQALTSGLSNVLNALV